MRKNMKRVSAAAMSLMLVGGMLAGCSGSKNETPKATDAPTTKATESTGKETEGTKETEDTKATEADTKAPSGEEITLRFAWWGGDARHEATLAAIKLYEELNQGIKIEAEYQGYDGYYEKMITTMSSGTAPDIMQFHRDWVADVQGAKHYLADLSTLPIDTSTLVEGVLERSGSYDGEPVLYSCSVGGQVLYVNMEFAEKHNIDITKEYTWESFMELGKQIHDENPDEYLMAADIDVLNRLIILEYLAQQTGGSIVNDDYTINFDEAQMTASLQNIKDLYDTGTLEPFGESAVFVGQMEQNTKWVQGKIGMLLDITGGTAKYKASIPGELDVMAIPQIEDAVCSGVDYSGNMGFIINDSSPYKEEAAKFLDWIMNDEEAIKILKDCRGFPATQTALNTLEANGLLDETLAKASDIASKNAFSINAISGNTELETIRKDIIQEVIYGDSTPEEGAKEMIEAYEELLEGLKK